MATTPFLMMATGGCAPSRCSDASEREGPVDQTAPNAIVVGYGRFGQTVAQMLMAQGIAVTLIDTDIEMIDVAGSFGAKVYYGDGTRIDLLRQAGAAEAELILFCIDGDQIEPEFARGGARGLPPGRDLRPRLRPPRADQAQGRADRRRGARGARIRRCRMARMAMEKVGVDAEEIDRTEAALPRPRPRAARRPRSQSGDLRAPSERCSSPDNPIDRAGERGVGRARDVEEAPRPRASSTDVSTKACADPARQDEAAAAAPSCRAPCARRAGPASTSVARRQPDRVEMGDRPLGVLRPGTGRARPRAEGERHAERHRLAVQQRSKPVSASSAWPNVWPKLSKARRPARLALVLGDDRRLGARRRSRSRGAAPPASPASSAAPFASHQAKKPGSPIRPYLTTSA